jgi:hypothetical protein
MIASLLVITAIGQGTTINYGPGPGHVPIKPPLYAEEAYLAGQQEIAAGLKPHATIVFGQYIARTSQPISDLSGYLDMNPRDSLAKQPVKVGYAAFKVTNSTFEGKSCVLFESDSRRNRAREFRNSNELNVIDTTPVERYRKVWLNPDGVPIRETAGYRSYQGTWEMDARFGKEELEITLSGPKGKRSMNLVPAGGIELFANEFKPMVDGEKILLEEKKFSRLDPITGGITQITAKVAAKFEGSIFLKKFSGHRIDFTIGETKQIAFVSKDMDLLQVNLPHGESLVADNDPTEGRSGIGKLKPGGGG